MPFFIIIMNGKQLSKAKKSLNINLEDIINKIVFFCEQTNNIILYPYQKKFAKKLIESILLNNGMELTCLWARQIGKSETIATVVTGLLIILPTLAKTMKNLKVYERGFWIGLFAPTVEQCLTTFERVKNKIESHDVELIMEDPEVDVRVKESRKQILLTNGSILKYQTAAIQTKVESKSYHLVILEECQDIADIKIRKSISPMLAAYNGIMVKIGTSSGSLCDFYRSVERNKIDYPLYHFEYDYKVGEQYNPLYKKYIKNEIDRIGETSDEFRMSYCLHWLMEYKKFVTEKDVIIMRDKNLKLTKSEKNACVAGLDLAKGFDSTVLVIAKLNNINNDENYVKEVVAVLELKNENYEDQFQIIKDFISNYNVKSLIIDATGMGEIATDRLKYLLPHVNIEAFNFSVNSKSELFRYFYNEIRCERVKYPHQNCNEINNLEKQLLDLKKEYKGGYMIVKHPEYRNAHDDYVISLALAVWGARMDILPEIEFENEYLFKNKNTYRENANYGYINIGQRVAV